MGWKEDNSEADADKMKGEKNSRQSHTGFCREEKRNVCQVEKKINLEKKEKSFSSSRESLLHVEKKKKNQFKAISH